MNAMDLICSRKSIRSYTGENITDAELKTLLTAAYAAPIGRAEYDSLALTVITNPDLLKKLDENTAKLFKKPDLHPLYHAPMLIVVSTPLTQTPMDNIAYSNAAIIVENIALAAVELGIGSCHIWGAIMALKDAPELVAELNLPEGYSPCCSIILGKTNEKYEPREIPEERIKTFYVK